MWYEHVWGWVGFGGTVIGAILGSITFIMACLEYRAWKRREKARQVKIEAARHELINHTKKPLEEYAISTFARLVQKLLKQDLLAENPFKIDSEDFAERTWAALFNMIQNQMISEEDNSNEPDSK